MGDQMPDEYATQRELDQLAMRVHSIDEHGTRGVGIIQTQLTEVIKDQAKAEAIIDSRFTKLEADMNARFNAHQQQHETEKAERLAGRRWAFGFGVAALGSVGGLYPYLHAIAHH